MASALDLLLLPSDTPPRRSTLKRLLLFHRSITVQSPEDRCLIAPGEITERFAPPTKIREIKLVASYAPFPHSEGYFEALEALVRDARSATSRNLIRVSPAVSSEPPLWRLQSYRAAIARAELVRAAVPDAGGVLPNLPDGIVSGHEMEPQGYRSKFRVDAPPPFRIDGVDERWTAVADLRLARTIKYLNLARANGLVPVASDAATRRIVAVLAASSYAQLDSGQLADVAISLEAVDAEVLEQQLVGASFDDVLAMRREILPVVAPFSARVAAVLERRREHEQVTYATLARTIEELREEAARAHEVHAAALQSLGLTVATKALVSGATLFLTEDHLARLLVLASQVADLSGDVLAYVKVLQARRRHPFAVFEKSLKSSLDD